MMHAINISTRFWLGTVVILLSFLHSASGSFQSDGSKTTQNGSENELQKRLEQTNSKPWSYWWWMGSAVDKKNIDYNLKKYQEAGIGGLHIVPIYGVKGEEDKFIDYLSQEWVEMLAYTSEKCKELGIGLDMTLGTGWCFGGPDVDENSGTMYANIEKIKIDGGPVQLDLASESKYQYSKIQSVLAVLNDGSRVDISNKINNDQQLDWHAQQSAATLYIIRMEGPVFKVKRAAPGGEGFMLDPFSSAAIKKYTTGFDAVFQAKLNQNVRAIYHDSYEYKADWSHGLFNEFKEKRGYDLKMYIPELIGEGGEIAKRVIADFRQTMAELHEEYIEETKNWSTSNGLLFRNQGHGSPANWLDIYGLADIPETETFGATRYKIPGFTREEAFINNDQPNRFVMKFASSAAHVLGKPLVSSETNTWLREHFQVALSHSKPELDQLFLSGINHIFYHGIAYSPKEAEWPGWQFYASTSFAPTNNISQHFPAQNKYVELCQKALRFGQPDNDILLYYPIQDVWHLAGPMSKSLRDRNAKSQDVKAPIDILYKLTAHNYKDWFIPFPIHKVAAKLDTLGYSFDYISDKQLLNTVVDKGDLKTEGSKYKTLIIPKCEFMPIETLQAIYKLADEGARVIFLEGLPESVPGNFDLENRLSELAQLKNAINQNQSGNIKVLDDTELFEASLAKWNVKKEHFNEHCIPFIRRKTEDGYLYFISNIYSGKDLNDFITLGVDVEDVVITDPISEKSGKAILKRNAGETAMLLKLEQGQSLIIETFDKKLVDIENWHYSKSESLPMKITGSWKVEFIEGGPKLPASYMTNQLKSWTEDGDKEAKRFAGTARYTIKFELAEVKADDYIIELEKVRESAVIRINGQELSVLFAHPFKISIGKYLNKGTNKLEIEVANLSANRIRDLDKRGVEWKKFHNINFVNIDYKPFDASVWELTDSGLIGKVQLVPVHWIR